jgi:hypothetical protein
MSTLIFSRTNVGREVTVVPNVLDTVSYVTASGEQFRVTRETDPVGSIVHDFGASDIIKGTLTVSFDKGTTWQDVAFERIMS